MQLLRSQLGAFLLGGMVLGLISFPVGEAKALTDDQKCILAVNKRGEKAFETKGKEYAACAKDFAKGKVSDLEACVVADRKGKVAKANLKIFTDWTKKCVGKGVAPPSFGPTDPNVIRDEASGQEDDTFDRIFGTDLNPIIEKLATNKDKSKCQQALIKDILNCQKTKGKEYLKCKKTAIKAGISSNQQLQDACTGTGASGQPDPKGKIAKKCSLTGAKPNNILKDLIKKCEAKGISVTQAFPGECDGGDPEAVAACMDSILDCEICEYWNSSDNTNRDCDLFDDSVANGSCSGAEPPPASPPWARPPAILKRRRPVSAGLLPGKRVRIRSFQRTVRMMTRTRGPASGAAIPPSIPRS